MKIVYIKLVNFIGVNAAMGLREVSFSFDQIEKPIIQIYGKNGCGKTVLIQQLHPFSNINLNGDDRAELALILPKETGIKNIVYEVNDHVYTITHTYRPTQTGHTISSSLLEDGNELNPSGGVNSFNQLIERIFGINKYTFQFIINGTQLTSFANMSATQRKTLLNKAMGIDIYAKIHKLAKDDYRYTNKLITSLNNTKEYLLSTYGSYENLCTLLDFKQRETNEIEKQLEATRSRMDSLSGQISIIRSQNVQQDLMSVDHTIKNYDNIMMELGSTDENAYDALVDEQIKLNTILSQSKNERLLFMKDLDVLYSKRTDIQNTMMANQKAMNDYQEMRNMVDELKRKIEMIEIHEYVSSSSNYLMSMISVAQAVNGICKEIVTCLNENHLRLFVSMLEKDIDISAFLIKEGSILMDTEKEKSVISRIRQMLSTIDGDFPDDCIYQNCIYHKTHDMLENYFKSYQSVSETEFTQYDIEQFDHAYKNIQTLRRLIPAEVSEELVDMFDVKTITRNLIDHNMGIDVDRLKYLMEEAAKLETRTRYITQLNDMESSIETMKKTLLPTGNMDETIQQLTNEITDIQQKMSSVENMIKEIDQQIRDNDRKKMLLMQIKNVNIHAEKSRYQKLLELNQTLIQAEAEYSQLSTSYHEMSNQLNLYKSDLKVLQDADSQYKKTVLEIDKYQEEDKRYKIIAEATSSTKGKPVMAIRDTVNNALAMTNRLLDVIYDGEIELLQPEIDETTFTLPFRRGANCSDDVRFGSQSESCLLSLALSLSLSSSLTGYNVFLIDECDGYLDMDMSNSFILFLQNIMAVLKVEQCFIISHHVSYNQYTDCIHQLNISEEIQK